MWQSYRLAVDSCIRCRPFKKLYTEMIRIMVTSRVPSSFVVRHMQKLLPFLQRNFL